MAKCMRSITPEDITDAVRQRFWQKVRVGNVDQCWLWEGSTRGDGSYGIAFTVDLVRVSAHRLAYALANGECDKDLIVCHECDTPLCVNPRHLVGGTQGENIRDMTSKGRGKPGRAQFALEHVEAIRDRYAAGESQRSLAREYGVSQPAINNIVNNRVYKHVRRRPLVFVQRPLFEMAV
jgi:hypothetical protein